MLLLLNLPEHVLRAVGVLNRSRHLISLVKYKFICVGVSVVVAIAS